MARLCDFCHGVEVQRRVVDPTLGSHPAFLSSFPVGDQILIICLHGIIVWFCRLKYIMTNYNFNIKPFIVLTSNDWAVVQQNLNRLNAAMECVVQNRGLAYSRSKII